MKYLKIQNKGELDIRLVALMGGTTKSGDRFKIGQFGTGLKYTLAYLFRNNVDFKIFSGDQPVDVTTETEVINETSFEIICINGNRTSITTAMGHQWSAWMIIRELWCNALDEGGQAREITRHDEVLTGTPGTTTFYIQVTAAIDEVMENWGSYFIHNQEPMWENELYAIYPNSREASLKLYKHGVLIYQCQDQKSLFVYDIKKADINELREFRGIVSYEVFAALANPNQDVVAYFLNNINDKHYEGSELQYDWFTSFANIWKETIGQKKVSNSEDYERYKSSGDGIDFSNIIQLPKKVYKALVKSFEGIGAVAMTDKKIEFFPAIDPRMRARLDSCLSILSSAGYTWDENISFQTGVFKETSKVSGSNFSKKSIMLSNACVDMDDEKICGLLVGEIEYLKINAPNDERRISLHFINLYTRQLLATNAIEF